METKTETAVVKQDGVTGWLARLGFKTASAKVKELSIKKQKMTVAYGMYKWVRHEKIEAFNQKLKEKTHNWDKNGGYHKLSFTPIEEYDSVPPADVLDKLEKAQALEVKHGAEAVKVFDGFEIAAIRKVPDPLLFGRINGCTDRFFIAQWDTDVSITDLLGDKEC